MKVVMPMFAKERYRLDGRPSKEPRVIFFARDREHFLRAAKEKDEVRGRGE